MLHHYILPHCIYKGLGECKALLFTLLEAKNADTRSRPLGFSHQRVRSAMEKRRSFDMEHQLHQMSQETYQDPPVGMSWLDYPTLPAVRLEPVQSSAHVGPRIHLSGTPECTDHLPFTAARFNVSHPLVWVSSRVVSTGGLSEECCTAQQNYSDTPRATVTVLNARALLSWDPTRLDRNQVAKHTAKPSNSASTCAA